MSDSQSNSENNMVNLYNKRLKDFNIDEKTDETNKKLEQWRDECHKTIDEFYERKSEELKSYVDQFRTNYEETKARIQTNISKLDNQENTDIRTTVINSIEQDLNDIEQTSLQIQIRSLKLNENYIFIEKQFDIQKILSNKSQFLYTNDSSSAIASNDKYILIHQHPYLCLIDQDFKIIKQNLWSNGWIRDMCWSKFNQYFIIVAADNIYCINEAFQKLSLLNEDLKQLWFSCTCSDEHLYLSTHEWGSSIYQLNLSSPNEVVKQWKSPLTCEDYQGINDIKYNNETIALAVKDPKENKKFMVLKSVKTFETIWSLELSIGSNIRLFTCCPINSDEWLLVDGTNSHIYHITKDGKFKTNIRYPTVPYRANAFNSNTLAISAEFDLNLSQFSI